MKPSTGCLHFLLLSQQQNRLEFRRKKLHVFIDAALCVYALISKTEFDLISTTVKLGIFAHSAMSRAHTENLHLYVEIMNIRLLFDDLITKVNFLNNYFLIITKAKMARQVTSKPNTSRLCKKGINTSSFLLQPVTACVCINLL